MTYYTEGMPETLRQADRKFTELSRFTKRPSELVVLLGQTLALTQRYFEAKKTAGETSLWFITHLGRCDTCRGEGWERCSVMNDRMTSGKMTSVVALG